MNFEQKIAVGLGALYTIVGLGLIVYGVVANNQAALNIGMPMAVIPGSIKGAQVAGRAASSGSLKGLSLMLTGCLGLMLIVSPGCSSSEMLRNTDHSNEALKTGGQSLNSQRVTYADGTSATYEGVGDPMVATSTDNGFDLVGEGTVGGATILMKPDGNTTFRILGQNDVQIEDGEVTLPDGTVAKAGTFKILASETRRARNEALDRYERIIASLTPAQLEGIQAERDKFIEAAGAISDVAAGVIANLIPAPTP